MNIEEKVKMNLLTRGFDNKTQLNNRGLIEATIDETILEVVKNLRIADVSCQSEASVCPYDRDPKNCIRKADTCFKCLPIK